MKKYKEIYLWLIFGILVICVLIPLVYWIIHPELTRMEITIQFWPVYVLVLVIYFVNQKLLKL